LLDDEENIIFFLLAVLFDACFKNVNVGFIDANFNKKKSMIRRSLDFG